MTLNASNSPADVFDQTTIFSLLSTIVILAAATSVSRHALDPATPARLRGLFVWHAFDALIHFILEGSFLYHCFFSSLSRAELEASGDVAKYFPDPPHYLGYTDRVHGPQAGGSNPFAQLWMVYARADRRWAGVDLGVVSLEMLTVFVVGPMACLVCYDMMNYNSSKGNHRARVNITMIVLATAELYGGFMTFCPEWLTGNLNLDTSHVVYLWLYLIFFNMLWVFIPFYAIYVAASDIFDAFEVRKETGHVKKLI